MPTRINFPIPSAKRSITRGFVCGMLWLAAGLNPLAGEDRDARLLRELRRLQLFDVAERYCQQQLARTDLTSAAAVDFTVEQMRTISLHALSSPAAGREALWGQARKLAKEFTTKQPNQPRALLVRMQDALTVQAQGDQQRREAEALVENGPALATASNTLRTAEKMFDDLAQVVTQEMTQRRNQPSKGTELTADELGRLKMQAEFQCARTQWSRAYCYPAESLDRKALLLAALESVEGAVGRLSPQDELSGNLRVLQMACLRELKRYDEALRAFELVDRDEISSGVRREALAEALRVRALAGEPREALRMLEEPKYQALQRTREPELDLAKLEVIMRLAQQAAAEKKANDLAQWQQAAAQWAAQIERTHGTYWGRRADQLLAVLAGTSDVAADASVELLARQADANYLRGKPDEAQSLYLQAAQAAHRAGQSDREFDLTFKSGLIAQEQKQFAVAAARLERLAKDLPSHPKAPEAHLVACWNKAQQVRGDLELGTAYAAMLEEHLARWAASSTTDQANVWLGNWRQSQGSFSAGFQAYAKVRRDSPAFPAAIQGAATCARQELARLTSVGKPTEALAREYLETFRLALGETTTGRERFTDTERVATLAAADILVRYIAGGCASAETLLSSGLSTDSDKASAWRIEARSLLAVALAGQPKRASEAVKLLSDGDWKSATLFTVLERLSALEAQGSREQRTAIANVQLAVLERLNANLKDLSAPQKLELRRARATALAQAGNRAAALEAYAALAKEEPHNGRVQEAYAELLAEGTDAESLTGALGKWRQIAAKSPPHEPRWVKAKYAVASLQLRLGNKQEAATLVRYLLQTHAELDTSGWKPRFEELLAECER